MALHLRRLAAVTGRAPRLLALARAPLTNQTTSRTLLGPGIGARAELPHYRRAARCCVRAEHNAARGTLASSMRTHTCGELGAGNEGEEVRLCGWLQGARSDDAIHFEN